MRSIVECRRAAWAVRGATPPADSMVPKECRKECTSSVRPRSSAFLMPAAFRSRSKILISCDGTSNTGVVGGKVAGAPVAIDSTPAEADTSPHAAARFSATQERRSAARSSRMGSSAL
nr:hypothetical protein [Pirellulimonas nuda]